MFLAGVGLLLRCGASSIRRTTAAGESSQCVSDAAASLLDLTSDCRQWGDGGATARRASAGGSAVTLAISSATGVQYPCDGSLRGSTGGARLRLPWPYASVWERCFSHCCLPWSMLACPLAARWNISAK